MRLLFVYLALRLHWGTAFGATDEASWLECGVWIAPSTIDGPGLGMYAGRDFDRQDTLMLDLVIPIVDLQIH